MRDLKKDVMLDEGIMYAKDLTVGDEGMEPLSKREYIGKEIEEENSQLGQNVMGMKREWKIEPKIYNWRPFLEKQQVKKISLEQSMESGE